MADLNLLLLEFFTLLGIIIFIFGFSVISTEPTLIIFAIILIFVLTLPYVQIIYEIETLMFNYGLENELLFRILYPYSKLIIIFIGIFLIIELIYIFLFN